MRRRAAAVSEAGERAIFSKSSLDVGFVSSLPSFALVGIHNDDDDVALCSAVVCGRESECVCVCVCVCDDVALRSAVVCGRERVQVMTCQYVDVLDLCVGALCRRSPFISIFTIIYTISRDSIHYVQALDFLVMSSS